jgi:hypothetical protein
MREPHTACTIASDRAMNRDDSRRFASAHPARTAIEVLRLALVEIGLTAVAP